MSRQFQFVQGNFNFTHNNFNLFRTIGPLQVSIHVVQNRHIRTQTSHWDKTNKGNYHLKLCMPFVGLAPMRLLRPNMPVLYHVDGNLQGANFNFTHGNFNLFVSKLNLPRVKLKLP